LIYNSDGLIYKFDLKTLTPSVLNTGSISGNNNDHVISFDGKMLGISSNNKEDNASKVYTLPLSGGEPKQITPTGPSYLHGWSSRWKISCVCWSAKW
jgi:Tol biopolymer transport system component